MNQPIDKAKQFAKSNIDPRIVVSSVVASFVLGGVLFALNKTNVKALKAVAKVAK